MKIITQIITFLGIIFRKLTGFNDKYVFPFIDLLELVRDAVKSDSVKWLVELTNWDWDDKARLKVINKLSKTIIKLGLTSDCVDKDTPEEVINCFIKHLQSLPPVTRDAIIQKTAAVAVKTSFPNGKMKQNEADLAVQLAYSTRKEYKARKNG